MFCPMRYRLSFRLPDFIRELPYRTVSVTSALRNWVYTVTIEDPAGPYHVFLELRRAAAEQRTWQDLNLVVERRVPRNQGASRRAWSPQAVPPGVRGGVHRESHQAQEETQAPLTKKKAPVGAFDTADPENHLRTALGDYGFRRWEALNFIRSVASTAPQFYGTLDSVRQPTEATVQSRRKPEPSTGKQTGGGTPLTRKGTATARMLLRVISAVSRRTFVAAGPWRPAFHASTACRCPGPSAGPPVRHLRPSCPVSCAAGRAAGTRGPSSSTTRRPAATGLRT